MLSIPAATSDSSKRPFPRRLYKFFDEEEHARRLLNGHVWISTLQWLRETDRARGDRDEASILYEPGDIKTDDQSSRTVQQLANLESLGIRNMPGGTVSINVANPGDCRLLQKVENGFLFCCTTSPPTAKLILTRVPRYRSYPLEAGHRSGSIGVGF
jgi:hypothetical protein